MVVGLAIGGFGGFLTLDYSTTLKYPIFLLGTVIGVASGFVCAGGETNYHGGLRPKRLGCSVNSRQIAYTLCALDLLVLGYLVWSNRPPTLTTTTVTVTVAWCVGYHMRGRS
jgi:hypothetical protein